MLCHARIPMPIVKSVLNESWLIDDGKLLQPLVSLKFA